MPGTNSKEFTELVDIYLKDIYNENSIGRSDSAMIRLITYLSENNPTLFVEDILDEEDTFLENEKRKRVRKNRTPNLWETPWGQLLRDLANEDVPDRKYLLRKFRRRFRIPYDLFLIHVQEANEVNLFDIVNDSKISTEFRICVFFSCNVVTGTKIRNAL